jgi:NADH-quinone oxidoreductase subunit G
MVQLEVDGKPVEVAEGSMVMQAADKLGIYVPHFCYHKKLSIAANCRMCLVDVEKAPKPMPACATPVTNGMKVWTASDKAVKAQKSVMEFLLINHPLDCPICDQGGECQLQDLAVGYGGSASRYSEDKRVVFHKNLGPLVSAQEMSRCIHCTRCVRFGQEVAGVMELGMVGRGEHSEIVSFVGRTVESELSGNMIDVCPVGALTSKPFRYSARTWELSRRKTIAPHDSLGSGIVAQIKQHQVLRVVPLEDESLNECWISDRDRFSYEALNSEHRLLQPMIKQDGQWHVVEWQTALEYAASSLKSVAADHGADHVGVLTTGQATLEEMIGLRKLAEALGTPNLDFRPQLTDHSLDAHRQGAFWLGMPVADLSTRDRVLVIGSTLRKEHPLLASRLRQATKRGTKVSVIHAADDDLLMPVAAKAIAAPSQWLGILRDVIALVQSSKNGQSAPDASPSALAVAKQISSAKQGVVLVGNLVQKHPQFAALLAAAQELAALVGATVGVMPDSANSVGGYIAGVVPKAGGLNARAMIESPRKAYLLAHIEPLLDHAAGAQAQAALEQAATVIAMTSFITPGLLEAADCLLPLAPFTETSGTFINAEGRAQSFQGVVKPAGQARPGWKILRVLGSLLGAHDFSFETSEQLRDSVLSEGWQAGLDNSVKAQARGSDEVQFDSGPTVERLAETPIYAGDVLVRHAESLQLTVDAKAPVAFFHPETALQLGLQAGEAIECLAQARSGESASLRIQWKADSRVAQGVVRLSSHHALTAVLPTYDPVLEVRALMAQA